MSSKHDKVTLSEFLYLIKHLPTYLHKKRKERVAEEKRKKEEHLKTLQPLTVKDFIEYYLEYKRKNPADWIDKLCWIFTAGFVLFLIFFV